VIEGDWRPQRILIEQFASRQAIHAMHDDPENEKLKLIPSLLDRDSYAIKETWYQSPTIARCSAL
jgi:hypothetical protein